MNELTIRPERAADRDRIFAVEAAAFGQAVQAHLVDALRAESERFVSLVAERDGALVGHVSFSPVSYEAASAPASCQLSPLAVDPAVQRSGIGSALVEAGFEACRSTGWRAVHLLGDPNYYVRFGFRMANAIGLTHPGPDGEWLQVVELDPGALDGVKGEVYFDPVFARFE